MPAFSLPGIVQGWWTAAGMPGGLHQAARSAGCRSRLAAAASSAKPRRDHRPNFDCRTGNAGHSDGCTSIRSRETQSWQGFSGANMPAWYGVNALLSAADLRQVCLRPQDFWQKLKGPPTPLPKPDQQHCQGRQATHSRSMGTTTSWPSTATSSGGRTADMYSE